uniref:Uncharacterized protein n=1 Tax=Rhizophora mucronata TaxID=61149 RepID=A0A2P2MMD3_RHIMU
MKPGNFSDAMCGIIFNMGIGSNQVSPSAVKELSWTKLGCQVLHRALAYAFGLVHVRRWCVLKLGTLTIMFIVVIMSKGGVFCVFYGKSCNAVLKKYAALQNFLSFISICY